MRHIVSIGGGYTSTIELPMLVIEKYGAENVDLLMACLAGESPDLWRLVEECERLTGKHVKRITYQPASIVYEYKYLTGQPLPLYLINVPQYLEDAPSSWWWDIWDVFFSVGRMGSSLADPCSRILKRETLAAYIEDHYTPTDTVLHVGITAKEIDRMLAIQRNWGKRGYRVEADLCDVALVGTSAERCKARLGWTPRLYEWGASHNNCGGFCVKAGHAQMARLLWYERDLYLYHEGREAQFQEQFATTATIMRDRVTKARVVESIPLTMAAFRERMEARWAGRMFPAFDDLEDTAACVFCDSAA